MPDTVASDGKIPQGRILFLTKYGPKGASSRYRAYQYWEYLQQSGYSCDASPLFPDGFLTRKYRAASSGSAAMVGTAHSVLSSLVRRWWLVQTRVPQYDLVYLEGEALPYLPFVAEQALFDAGTRVVVDYGDALTLRYEQHRLAVVRQLLADKIPNVIGRCTYVVAANRHLAEWACRFNENVTVIPTSVDLRRYPGDPAHRVGAQSPVVGWIGTPITARYLEILEGPLRTLRARYDFTLRVIGAPDFTMPGVDVETVPWRESSEVDELRKCDVGVMPLPDDAWAQGKSALKVIQYMAAGVPAVASAVGTNRDVLTDGETGFLIESDEDWVEKLALLLENPPLRLAMARAARRVVENSFSLEGNAPRLIGVFNESMGRRRQGLRGDCDE